MPTDGPLYTLVADQQRVGQGCILHSYLSIYMLNIRILREADVEEDECDLKQEEETSQPALYCQHYSDAENAKDL